MALGRGLGALIEDADSVQHRDTSEVNRHASESVSEVDIEKIQANPFQPRSTFDEDSLQELADSIKELGIIQPLTLRNVNGAFQLISGERRLRSSCLFKWS